MKPTGKGGRQVRGLTRTATLTGIQRADNRAYGKHRYKIIYNGIHEQCFNCGSDVVLRKTPSGGVRVENTDGTCHYYTCRNLRVIAA